MTAMSAKISPIEAIPHKKKRTLMSRLWPLSGRRVKHHTFGTLKPWRNGRYLRAKTEFAPLGKRIWLVIRADDAEPSALQEKLFVQIEKHYPALLPRILKALLVEYHKVRRVQANVAWPEAAKPADLLKIIPLDAIWLEHGPGHPFVLSFQSELDKDHEFHVFFRDGKLESVLFEN